MAVVSIPLSQFFRQSFGVSLVYGAVWAGVVTLPKFMAHAVVIRSGNLRVALDHPGRQGCGRSSQHDLAVFPAEHFYNIIQFREIIGFLRGLQFRPGKYIDGGAVDVGFFKETHVLLPDIPGPLVGVIIPAI